jgi:hypothetical protein
VKVKTEEEVNVMPFFGFDETEGYGAQPYSVVGMGGDMGEDMGQVPAIPTPSPSFLSILDEFKTIWSLNAGKLIGIGLAILFYIWLKEKKYL